MVEPENKRSRKTQDHFRNYCDQSVISVTLIFLLSFPPCQDMRSPRFAYKTEKSHLDVVEVLAKHAFPLSHSLVSHFKCVD